MKGWWVLMLIVSVIAAAAAEPPFEYGSRPPNGVFDGTGTLSPQAIGQISDPLAAIRENEGVDVLVVVLRDLEGAPAKHVAGRFSEMWCQAPLHAVVLHVPGNENAPWIVPGGRLARDLQPDKVRKRVAEACRRASAEPTDDGKVRAAATEASDMLRYWMATEVNRSEVLKTARTRMRVDLERKARQRRIAILVLASSVVPLVVGVSMLVMMFRRPGPRSFPEPRLPVRLGAPHAGGNHAVVSLGGAANFDKP